MNARDSTLPRPAYRIPSQRVAPPVPLSALREPGVRSTLPVHVPSVRPPRGESLRAETPAPILTAGPTPQPALPGERITLPVAIKPPPEARREVPRGAKFADLTGPLPAMNPVDLSGPLPRVTHPVEIFAQGPDPFSYAPSGRGRMLAGLALGIVLGASVAMGLRSLPRQEPVSAHAVAASSASLPAPVPSASSVASAPRVASVENPSRAPSTAPSASRATNESRERHARANAARANTSEANLPQPFRPEFEP